MTPEELQSQLEALLFVADRPLSAQKLQECLASEFPSETPLESFKESFENALTALQNRYSSLSCGIELVEVGGGWQLRTKLKQGEMIKKLAKVQTQKLSTGAMETLAIIAYRQPLMKEEIDRIRGVDSSYFIRSLLERKLVKISGRSELPGRPILYATTQDFLELFGLKDLSSLPSLRELEQMVPVSQSEIPEEEAAPIKKMRQLVQEMNTNHLLS